MGVGSCNSIYMVKNPLNYREEVRDLSDLKVFL